MRKTQAIFRAVIRAGLYAKRPGEDFMCHALRKAEAAGIISSEEMGRAKTAIQQYMRRLAPDATVLRLALLRAGIDCGRYDMWVARAGTSTGTGINGRASRRINNKRPAMGALACTVGTVPKAYVWSA